MSKTFYNAQNLTIGNGFVRNPDRYYLEEFFGQLPRIQYKKFSTNIGRGTIHTNSEDEAVLSSISIPANSLLAGDVLHIFGYATVIDKNAADTSIIKLRIDDSATDVDGTVIATGPTQNVSVDDIVHIDYYLTIRTTGNTGTMVGHGILSVGASSPTIENVTIASSAIDTESIKYINLTNIWSAAHADNQIASDSFAVELKRLEIPNNNFTIEGDGASNNSASYPAGEQAGINLASSSDTTSVIITPNTNTNQTAWHNVKWGTENQVEWECAFLTTTYLADSDMKIWAGLKLTNTDTITTDNDQIYFLYDSTNLVKSWRIVISINGTDYVSNTPVTVKQSTIYKFRISIDNNRFARVFINDIQYNITTSEGDSGTDVTAGIVPSAQLKNDVDFVPKIGLYGDGTLIVCYQKISRVLHE